MHQLFRLLLKRLIDLNVLSAVSEALVLLILREEIVFNLDKGFVTNFLELSSKIIILLLKLLDILVLHSDCATESGDLILLGLELLFVISAYFFKLGILLSEVILSFLELSNQLLEVRLRVKLCLQRLVLISCFDDLSLSLCAVVLILSLKLGQAHGLITQTLCQVLDLVHLLLSEFRWS